MTLNPLKWIEWLINEHGSSTVLRERLAHSKDVVAGLERKVAELIAERDDFKLHFEKAQIEIDDLRKANQELLEDSKPTSGRPGRGF